MPWYKVSSTRLISPSFLRVRIVPTGNTTAQKWCCAWHYLHAHTIFYSSLESSLAHSGIPLMWLFICFFSYTTQNSCIINNAWSQYMTLHQWLWNQGWFVPWGDIWQHLEIFLVVSVGERGLIASNKQRLRMLLNNLQDIGWLLRKKYVAPMTKVPRLRSHSTEIKALTYPSSHLILITPLRWKPGQYSHSSPSISL